MLFSRPLKTTAKAKNVFKVVAAYFDDKVMKLEKRLHLWHPTDACFKKWIYNEAE